MLEVSIYSDQAVPLQITLSQISRFLDAESVAAHMYRMSMLSFLIPEASSLDRVRCMKMALVHDLAEAIVGDITPYCGVDKEEKKRREMKAVKEIAALIPEMGGDEILVLFEEYEAQKTQEALWVKDCDRYDMIQQAFEYEKRDKTPKMHQEFFDSTRGKFLNPFFVHLVEELNKQREEYSDEAFGKRQAEKQTV
jgi:putative hydrolases of HD superfamily